jgi:hypothetical protein
VQSVPVVGPVTVPFIDEETVPFTGQLNIDEVNPARGKRAITGI